HDRAKGVDILMKDLKVFASFNEELFKEITHLLTLENFSGARAPPPTNGPLVGTIPKSGAFPPIGAHSVTFCGVFKYLSLSNLQAALAKDASVSVNRCLWSPDGSILGTESKT
ncbi:hypothetical protein BHE74_00044198, partial [Ensete ventricosum]